MALTWPKVSGSTSTLLEIFEGTRWLASTTLNQNLTLPGSFTTADGKAWQVLGVVTVTGDTLRVRMSNGAILPLLADAVRLQRIGGNFGKDDDFRLLLDSPAVDRGNVQLSGLLDEPVPNGGRVDIGAYGDRTQSVVSAESLVQLLTPNGLEKFEAGQTVQVTWRSVGLTPYEPVALINVGGAAVSGVARGEWQANAYQTVNNATTVLSTVVDTSGVANPGPQAVYQDLAWASSGVNQKIAWQIPVADGTYRVRLHFVEDQTGFVVGQRKFDIKLQGALVADDFDIRKEAGAAYRAIVREFDVTVSGGQGIALELLNQTNNPALLSGIEVLRADGGRDGAGDGRP